MTLKPRTIAMYGLGAAVLAGLLYYSFRTDPVPIDEFEITRAPLMLTIEADGKTQIRNIYEVAAPISGMALRSPVAVGDAVVGGQTIVAIVEPVAPSLLDSRSRLQAESAVHEAEAALNVAETDLRKAIEDRNYVQSQFDRTKTLVERGVASITQLEDVSQRLVVAKAAEDAALARIDMSKSTLQRAQAALIEPDSPQAASAAACCVRLVAPVDGVILDVPFISERPVAAGTALVSVGDPQDLEIVADLLSIDAVRLAPGAMSIVDRWGGSQPLMARLARVDPSARTKVSALGIEEQRVSAIFELTSPPEDRPGLGHEFSVLLKIIEWQADDVLQVPLGAVFRRGEDWAVFVSADGLAQERIIELGHRNSRHAEVLSGLSAGEMVITHPSDTITDGTAIVSRASLQK